MKTKLFMVLFFLVFTPILIISEFFLLQRVQLLSNRKVITPVAALDKQDLRREQAVVGSDADDAWVEETKTKGLVVAADARPLMIRNYLEKYNSPLASYADLIFRVSQKYGLDYRLIIAIAQQESNLCKKSPSNCFNCWGAGIHSRGTMCFDTYTDGIEWMGNYLRTEYLDKGLTSLEQIMGKYCPLSNGSWAFGVNQFMDEIGLVGTTP